MVTRPAIIILQPSAMTLAETIANSVDGDIHGPQTSGTAKTYVKFADHLRTLFAAGTPVIGICATGILVRILGPELSEKTTEPPVIAVSEDGASIVPLLGGHNGANRLATRVAEATSGHPAITTASDTAFGVALDDPPAGYVLANREHIKTFVSAMLAGATVKITGNAPWLATALPPSPSLPPKGREGHRGTAESPLPLKGGGLGRGDSPKSEAITGFARKLRKQPTEPERRLWSKLRGHRFENLHFRRQKPVAGYFADFCCTEHNLVIEVDGGTHSTEAELAHDRKRNAVLTKNGYTVLRFTNEQVMKELDGVLETISAHLATAEPPSPSLPPKGRESQNGTAESPLPLKGGGLGRGDGDNNSLAITITTAPLPGTADHLVYHPKTLALGIGCERGAGAEDLIAHIDQTLNRENIAPAAIALIASIDLKSDEAAIQVLSRHLNVPARFFTPAELNDEAPRLANPSDIVMAEVGCPGVAEGAALAGAGPDARLKVEKSIANRTTCAIATAAHPIIDLPGTPQGRLFVVGIGPGMPDWRSPAAKRALETATDWVGYGLYLDLVEDLLTGQTEHRFPLGGEEDRVRHAINEAAKGKDVALICSGDAGIYAMAALVYEVLHLEPQRIAVDVIPGISAFQAAAARAGALIGHDFCCISLSDLLTPWEMIETRLKAAAEGDFVIAFYNPRSLKRTTQLAHAIEMLSPYRTPHTPVVIASNLGRPDETVRIVPLKDFDPEDVDMLTLVMVGASQSQTLTRGDGATYAYTPRGYARKRQDLAS